MQHCGHIEMSCTSENHTGHLKETECGFTQLCTLPSLNKQACAPQGSWWTQPSDQLPSQGSAVCGLTLAFLSRLVEMGLMKCSLLSDSCLNIHCGIHLQLVPAEADHHTSVYTLVSYRPPFPFPSIAWLPPPSILDH